ncbi:FtsW/RodA/SpoVE family cell cycle protein [Proteiniborus sp. MB09-C3]|uniref:FtsW/RodA/SpoVE family cell cycle protein n=1 Tax=Proteiniborus sp. MB09-C3 TaxID=3050072 RepID=UPI0025541B07|nr:FtsW/RodA/SpoVE family cell cycle protein [Proteiniborus sp. MB09-C3]WIV10443.1 FtsW/RodA/SpoVE family cell cycle protein [Proteiniborus sp. MB09-C3]
MTKKLLGIRSPQSLLMLINILALLLLITFNTELERNIIYSAIVLILTISLSSFVLYKISSGDNYIFLIVTMLISIGIIMIYRINPALGFKQILWFGIGIIVFFISYFTIKNIKYWDKLLYFYLGLSLVLFLATLIFGTKNKGATNWIIIFGSSFQPAELIKILFIFSLASYYTNKDKYNNKLIFLAVVYAHIGFLFIQKDLGTAMLFFLLFISILYVYEEDRRLILYNMASAVVLGVLGYFMFNHVRVRVETWINPWADIDGKGYQITQSLFAIASGGFFGTGIGLGHPEFIPEVHNDFIFSAICEEMGVFTGIAVIFLFLIIVYRGVKIALQQQNQFFRIIALGITLMFGYQAFIILGGVTKMIPLTGITLPFVSYGGSSLVSSFAALGILQVASEELDLEQEEEDEHRIQEDN